MEVDEIPSDACGNDEEANDGVANNVEILRSTHSLPLEFGMEFESDEHAILYYKKYAESVGFSTRKEYVNKNKAGCVTSRKVTCFKEGYRGKDRRDVLVKNPRKDTRTGCLAHIVISRDQLSGKYRITSLEPEHNHPLDPKGSEHVSQKKVKKVQAHPVGLSDDSEICPKILRQNGERAYFGSSYNDQRYCLHTKRQKDMKLGEACNLLQYFERRKLEDPSFFFSIQLDVDDLITNIFWADVKMIVDHKLFGDVLSFDTTYIRDGNYRPLGLFAGINNYREMVLFGAALMYDETVESFQWLFETFLRTMSDRKPKTILTDEDVTISKAILLVMPEANHRLCVWHIEQNAVKHLNDVFLSSDSFKKDFYQCIHEFEEENEFLTAWEVILENYNLRDNDWLKGIFALREKWAMVYGRSAFSAGLRSTQLNESFTAALRDYLKSDEDLVRFCEHLEKAVDDMRYKELEVSSGMTRRSPCLKVDLPLLIHARDVYTSVIFEMFQDEWVKSMHVVVNSRTINGTSHIYKASMLPHPREYTIIAKPLDAIVSCSCKKFEYLGILCSHALKILDLMNLKLMIPSHFIMKRWTKDARVGSIDNVGDIQEEDHILKVANRYRMLCPTFVQIAARASESKAGYELAAKYANEMAAKLEAVIKAEQSREAPAAASISLETFDFENNHVGDSGIVPDVSNATWQSLVAECDVPVLVEFWAPWSGPCRMIHPVVAKLSKVYESRLRCFKLNTDESTEIAARYEIGSIPAIVIFKNGEKKDTVIGVVPESTLVSCIEKFLGAASWFSLFRN